MRPVPTRLILLAAVMAACAGAGPTTREAPPPPIGDRPATASDAEDAYAAAVQQLRSAEAAVLRARQQAVSDYRATPPYVSAAHDLAVAFDAYAERRNALLMGAEQRDPRYGTWKKAMADKDGEIAQAGQTPSVTPDQFGELLNQRASFLKQLQALEDDAIGRDPDAKQLRQRWMDASARLSDLQGKQQAAVDGSAELRAALSAAAEARAALDRARAALPAGTVADGELSADEFVRRFPRHGLGWTDAWLSPSAPAAK